MCGAKDVLTAKEQSPIFAKIDLAYLKKRVKELHAAVYSKKPADVDELLDKGISADLGERWNAIVSAASTLSQTPPVFGKTEIDALRAAGLDDDEIFDVIHAVSFFNWANRLMLSLGEPELQQK